MGVALIAGNWKMNGTRASLAELDALIAAPAVPGTEWLICPPATLLAGFAARAAGTSVRIGAQDCHWKPAGAHTGDLSAAMLVDAGASSIIVGHSERRADHGETDATVRAKAEAALAAGAHVILCIGETLAERRAGETLAVLRRQLEGSRPDGVAPARLTLAYEPVWAIGTGLTPTMAEIEEAHAFLKAETGGLQLLYGGSVKPDNAAEILATPGVDGALVGGASLKAADFLAIAGAAPRP